MFRARHFLSFEFIVNKAFCLVNKVAIRDVALVQKAHYVTLCRYGFEPLQFSFFYGSYFYKKKLSSRYLSKNICLIVQ